MKIEDILFGEKADKITRKTAKYIGICVVTLSIIKLTIWLLK